MPQTYARFASTPIGPGLTAQNNGLTLTTTADAMSIDRTARSDVGRSAGVHGAEFTFYGTGALVASIGVAQPGTSLSTALGVTADAVGWRVNAGVIHVGNSIVASGLPVVSKGEIVGVSINLADNTIAFYKGSTLVHARSLPNAGATWHFAVSLASTVAGDLACAVNAGQWQAASAAAQAGWMPSAVAAAPLRLADQDWLSSAADAPAHARYEGLLDPAGLTIVSEVAFWPWGGEPPAEAGVAQVTVLDPDGLLDAHAQQAVSGLPVAVRLADLDGTLAASAPVARFAVDRIETLDDGRKSLFLRDAHADLDDPITRGVFLPNVPALAWQPQPVVIGAVASIPALPANSDGSVAWLADAPLAAVSAVLDRGDAMEAGTYTLAPDKQQLTLAMPPVGPVVVDASSVGAAMQPATLEQALREVFRRIGKAAWSASDAAAIDAATGYAGIGFYAAQPVTARQALAQILPSYGAWWWQAPDGVIRLSRIVDPASIPAGSLAFDLTDADLSEDLVARPDDAPNLSRRMAFRPNARVLGAGEMVTDLVDVPISRREELAAAWRGQVYSGASLAPRYAHADANPPLVSVFWRPQDAQAEIDRVCGLYSAVRQFYMVRTAALATPPAPGQVGRITYPRYGLAAGRQVLVRRVERNPASGDVVMILWG